MKKYRNPTPGLKSIENVSIHSRKPMNFLSAAFYSDYCMVSVIHMFWIMKLIFAKRQIMFITLIIESIFLTLWKTNSWSSLSSSSESLETSISFFKSSLVFIFNNFLSLPRKLKSLKNLPLFVIRDLCDSKILFRCF